MDGSDLARISAFEHRFAMAQATDVVDLPWGYVLLQADVPHSYDHNRVVVTAAASAPDIVASADRVLGGAGLQHRYVSVEDDALGQAVSSDLVAAGYEHETIVAMIHSGPTPESSSHEVREVSLDALHSTLVRDWRDDLPDATDEELDQLASRTALYAKGADVTALAVFEGEEVAARANLFFDLENGLVQLENLYTQSGYRGRGYADAVVREGLLRGRLAGCEVSFLTADADDWPHDWYLRHGYVDAYRTHHFTRTG